MPNDYLPERRSDHRAISPLGRAQIGRHQRRAEMDVIRYGINAWKKGEQYRIDVYVSTDAARTALEEELAFFDYGTARVNGSQVGQELLARKLSTLSAIHDARLIREFGR